MYKFRKYSENLQVSHIIKTNFCGRGWIRTNVFDICKCCPLTTKVRGLDRDSYPSSRPPGWPIGFRVFQADAVKPMIYQLI